MAQVLGRLIKLYRVTETPRMTARDMAERIGLSPSTILRIESGQAVDARTMHLLNAFLYGFNDHSEPSAEDDPDKPIEGI